MNTRRYCNRIGINRFLLCLLVAFAFVSCAKEVDPILVDSISLSHSSLTLVEGESYILSVKILPENADNKSLTWHSSNTSTAIVKDGRVLAQKEGKAIITATVDGEDISANCTIIVLPKQIPATNLSIDQKSISLIEGETYTLTVQITPDNATNQAVSWQTTDPQILSVNNGKIKALASGVAEVYATLQNLSDTCKVEVIGVSMTGQASQITLNSAVINGKANLPNSSGADLKIGIYYSTSAGVLPSSSIEVEATEFDADYNYSISITGLEPATTYYYRSYVYQNGVNTYGGTKSFTTSDIESTILAQDVVNLRAISADVTCVYNLEYLDLNIIETGFLYSVDSLQLSENVKGTLKENISSATIKHLSPDSKYYFKPYLRIGECEYFGLCQSFSTKGIDTILQTLEATNINGTSVSLGAKIDISEISFSSLSYGFIWGTSPDKLKYSRQCNDLTEGEFTCQLTDLSHQTTYWFRSYISVDGKIYYGNLNSFTTGIVSVEDITLNVDCASIVVGENIQLVAEVSPSNSSIKSVKWNSSDETIATVNSSGLVKGISKGNAIITVTTQDGNHTDCCIIEVENDWGIMGYNSYNNHWSKDVQMTKEGDWFVAKSVSFKEITFKIRANASWEDGTDIGVAPGTPKELVNKKIDVITGEYSKREYGKEASDIRIVGEVGTYDVYFSYENLEVYVMEPGFRPGEVGPPAKSYTVVGTMLDNIWDVSASECLMVAEGDYYVARNLPFVWESTLYGSGDHKISFKIIETGTWEGYGAAIYSLKKVDEYIDVNYGGVDITIDAPEGAYDVYLDRLNNKVWVTPSNT